MKMAVVQIWVTENRFESKSKLLIMTADLTRKLCKSKIRVFLDRNW
jgi:hypothetical protein